MISDELRLLQCVANGELRFHNGAWGDHAGYRWNCQDGTDGEVPPWQCDILDELKAHGLIMIEQRLGPLERRVLTTQPGISALYGLADAA